MSGLTGSFDDFVGIDVSKDKFDVCGITGDAVQRFQFSASMDRKGFNKLKEHLATISVSSVLIGMESTASYHINLFSYLVSEGYRVIIINPLLISNYGKMQLRKTKTDKKDAAVIAMFLLAHRNTLNQRLHSPLIPDLRDLSRQRENLVDEMTALKINIKRLLNITFPELEHMTAVFTKAILKLLQQYPSAVSLRDANLDQMSKMLMDHSYGHKREAFATKLIETARSSVGTNNPANEIILKQQVALLMHLEGDLHEITGILITMSRSLMEKDMNIITAIRGIGEKTAANFLIEMGGSINLYDHSGKIIAMAGLDPAVYQSGKHEGKGRIMKRGNRHLRRFIWLMTTKVIHYNDTFNGYYLKRREEGLPYKMAVLATAHKLIRVIYAMLTQRTTFCLQVNS